jgi:hypothetical protein
VGPTFGLDTLRRKNILFPSENQISVVHRAVRRCTEWAIPANSTPVLFSVTALKQVEEARNQSLCKRKNGTYFSGRYECACTLFSNVLRLYIIIVLFNLTILCSFIMSKLH